MCNALDFFCKEASFYGLIIVQCLVHKAMYMDRFKTILPVNMEQLSDSRHPVLKENTVNNCCCPDVIIVIKAMSSTREITDLSH